MSGRHETHGIEDLVAFRAEMSVSSGSDVTIPIQDSPPPPPSPYANRPDDRSKTPEPRGDDVAVGIDNEGFQSEVKDDGKIRAHTKITMNGKGTKNGSDPSAPVNEAVNTELINLNILNTIPDKPQPEFGPYDNFDEYFIPVNQHKKFLRRSEKLYVTKDKRKESHWKKYICWLIGAFVLASVVTIAVLAGVGLIPQKSSNNLMRDSVVSTTAGDVDGQSVFSTTEKRVPDMSSFRPDLQDNTYIPQTLDFEFNIVDLEYEAALNDPTTDRFKELSAEVESEMKVLLRDRLGLDLTSARILSFTPGNKVHVKLRMGWVDDSKTTQDVQFSLSRLIHFGRHKIMAPSTYQVVNRCKFNKDSCSHFCTFDSESLDFLCTCPETMLLGTDKKMCISIETSSEAPENASPSEDSIPETLLPGETSSTEPETTDAAPAHSVSDASDEVQPESSSSPTPEEVSSSAAPSVQPEPVTTPSPLPEQTSSSVRPESIVGAHDDGAVSESETDAEVSVTEHVQPVSQVHHSQPTVLPSTPVEEQPQIVEHPVSIPDEPRPVEEFGLSTESEVSPAPALPSSSIGSTSTTRRTTAVPIFTEHTEEPRFFQPVPDISNMNRDDDRPVEEDSLPISVSNPSVATTTTTTTTTTESPPSDEEVAETTVRAVSEENVSGIGNTSVRTKSGRQESFGDDSAENIASLERTNSSETEPNSASVEIRPVEPHTPSSSEIMVFSDHGDVPVEPEGTTDSSTQLESGENASGSDSVETEVVNNNNRTNSENVKMKEALVNSDEVVTSRAPSLLNDTLVNEFENVTEDHVNAEAVAAKEPEVVEETTRTDPGVVVEEETTNSVPESNNQQSAQHEPVTSTTAPHSSSTKNPPVNNNEMTSADNENELS